MLLSHFIELLKDPIEFMLFDRNNKFIALIHDKNEINNQLLSTEIKYISCNPLSIYLKMNI